MKNISVLFVDDEPWCIEGLFSILTRRLNAHVSIASTLGTAIEKLKKEQFDIIILDCKMARPFPGITISDEVLNFDESGVYTGPTFLKYIRLGTIGKLIKKPEIRNLPVILYTVAAHNDKIMKTVSKFENTRLCSKHYGDETLIELIRSMLQNKTM